MAEFETDIEAIVGARTTPTLRDRLRARYSGSSSTNVSERGQSMQSLASQRRYLLALSHNNGVPFHEVEDSVQDTFLKAIENLDKFNPQKGELGSWTTRMHLNALSDKRRAEKRRSNVLKTVPLETEDERHTSAGLLVEDSSREGCVEDAAIQGDISLKFAESLKSLPPEQQDAIKLVYYGDRTNAEAAKELGIPTPTLKRRLGLAKKKLADREDLQAFVEG